MKSVFRLKRRNGIYYSVHTDTGRRESLATRDRNEAIQMLAAKTQAHQQPILNLKMARVYLSVSDPQAVTRIWRDVLRVLVESKKGENRNRWKRLDRHPPFEGLWNRVVIEATAEHLWECHNTGTVIFDFLRQLVGGSK